MAIALVIGYAFSPIDLVPDFIPVFGLLDDLLILPLGILLAIRMIPEAVMTDARRRVESGEVALSGRHWLAGVVIAATWAALAFGLVAWGWRRWA